MSNGIAGMPASPGIVDGQVHLLIWEVPDVRHRIIPDEAIPAEVKRFHAAKQRLAAGTYGLSIESGEPIPDERLEILPTAERTADEERARRQG